MPQPEASTPDLFGAPELASDLEQAAATGPARADFLRLSSPLPALSPALAPPLSPALSPADRPSPLPSRLPTGRPSRLPSNTPVRPAPPTAHVLDLAARLHARWGGRLHLGTSSWYFPGWAGQVWEPHAGKGYAQQRLTRHGLPAYAQHPLLRAVSLDRAFYRPLEPHVYQALAAQVPDDFRFVVKAAAAVSDATLREPGTGAVIGANPLFLDPQAAVDLCVKPAVQGLGDKFGALVFQLSPLPAQWLRDGGRLPDSLLDKLAALWTAVRPALPTHTLLGLELRDPEPLTPTLAAQLKAHGVRYCLGLHDRMPPIDQQLPLLRALWPGDLVCRWNLQRGLRYTQARAQWEPFDRMQAPDLPTRQTLARVARATLDAGRSVFITINNKAEGSAPASVVALAEALLVEPEPIPARAPALPSPA